MSDRPDDCEHCGYPIDSWDSIHVNKPGTEELLVVDNKYLAICYCSCEDCALPNVWYEWR
jgi:hypothetical protein